MNMHSKLVWECIDILKGREKDHHNSTNNMYTKKAYVTMAENCNENMRVVHSHFQKLFNNHKHTDFRVLEIIKQQQTMWHIYDPITWDEFNRATNGIKSTKVAVLNGVPPEAFKATDKDCRRYVFELINAFWHEKADFDNYHKSQCVPVPKSGDLSDPNKW